MFKISEIFFKNVKQTKHYIHVKDLEQFVSGYSYGYVEDMGFSQGTGPILFGYLDCNGTEANLVECTQNYNNTHTYCQSHYYDVAIVCESKYLNILNISMHYIN